MSGHTMSPPVAGAPMALALPQSRKKVHLWLFAIMAVGFLLAPLGIYPIFMMKVMCFALFACAFNLLSGHLGLLSFGHAAFFGAGAYVAGYAAIGFGLTPELALLICAVCGGALGAGFACLSIRRSGLYMTMITLALAQVVYFICLQLPQTGGDNGMQGIGRGAVLGLFSLADDRAMYLYVWVIFLAGFALVYRLLHSPTGQVITAIRGNEARAVSLGYGIDGYKIFVFAVSAALSAVAGGLKAQVFGVATLTDVHFMISGEVLLITLLGGLATIFGPVIGAIVVLTVESLVAPYGAWVLVAQGILFMVCVLAFPSGVAGTLAKWLKTRL